MKSRLWTTLVAGGILTSVQLVSPGISVAQYAPPTQTTPQVNPMLAPRKAVTDAFAEVQKTRAALAKVRGKVEASFSSKDDWIAAKKELDAAKADYEAAVKPVLDKVHKDPAYKQAVADQIAAQKTLDTQGKAAAKTDGDAITSEDDGSNSKGDVLKDAAALQLKAGLAKSHMENEALADDPKVSTAKTRLADARKAYAELQTQVDDAVQIDPEYIADQQQLTAAEQRWTQAKLSLATAEKAQRDAEASKAKAAAQSHTSSNTSSGSSRR